MPTLTLALGLGAMMFVALFALNAVFYRRRHGTWLLSSERAPWKVNAPLGAPDILSAVVMVGGLVCASLVRFVVPDSAFAIWLGEPLAWLIFAVWSWAIATVVYVVAHLVLHKPAAWRGSDA